MRGHQSSLIELLLNHLSGTVPSSCVGKCYPFPEKPSFHFRPQFTSGENLSLLSSSSAAYYVELKFFEALSKLLALRESLKQFSSGCSRWQRRAAFLAPTPLLLTTLPNESINPGCISTTSPVLLHFCPVSCHSCNTASPPSILSSDPSLSFLPLPSPSWWQRAQPSPASGPDEMGQGGGGDSEAHVLLPNPFLIAFQILYACVCNVCVGRHLCVYAFVWTLEAKVHI